MGIFSQREEQMVNSPPYGLVMRHFLQFLQIRNNDHYFLRLFPLPISYILHSEQGRVIGSGPKVLLLIARLPVICGNFLNAPFHHPREPVTTQAGTGLVLRACHIIQTGLTLPCLFLLAHFPTLPCSWCFPPCPPWCLAA